MKASLSLGGTTKPPATKETKTNLPSFQHKPISLSGMALAAEGVHMHHHVQRQVLSRITDMIIATDEHGQINFMNPHAERILEVCQENYLGQQLYTCFPQLKGTLIEEQCNKAMHTRQAACFEAFFAPSARWYSINAYPSDTGLTLCFRDINEQYKTEDELRRSNERFRLAAKSDAIYDWDMISDQLHWGEGLNNFGYEQHELQIDGWKGAIHPADYEAVISSLNTAMAEPETQFWKADYRFKNKQGHYSFIFEKGHILRNEAGQAVRMVGILQDITERKKSEEELSRFSLVARQTNNLVAITSPDGRILWVNEAFTRHTGYSFAEAIGRLSTDLFDGPETDPEKIAFVQEQFRKQEPFQIQVLNYKKNGETYWVDLSCQPVFDEHGKLQHFFSIATDITERKKLRQVLEREKRKRQQMITAAAIKIQERERMLVGRELHDNVNQILTTVKLYTELCRDGIGDVPATLSRSLVLLQDCIDEVRCLSKRLSAPTLGSVPLHDSVLELTESVANTRKLEISLNCSDIENQMINQELHLAVYRILQEHLTNILKHAEARLVEVRISIREGNLLLQVTDDGRGFDPQAKRPGIGLANMQSRAESLHGSFQICSAPGQGCTILVQLPLPAL